MGQGRKNCLLHISEKTSSRFFICEILNLLNVSLQVYLIDSMLGGEFSTYGLNVNNTNELVPYCKVSFLRF